ncbi:MAG: AAA family ATPase [Actinomycetota bacterium]
MDEHIAGERILATVLFTDIVGSTEHAVEHGDRDWRDLLERHHVVVRRELGRFQGREIDTAGDGFLALFDAPARAILCAKAIVEGVQPLGLHIRAGIHTGETEVVGDDVRGIAVHIGARVAALANPDEILVSGTVKELVQGSHLEFTARGSRVLKGVPGRWRLFAVDRPVEEPGPAEAPPARPAVQLVGRTAELAVAMDRLEAAAAGSLAAITVEGEAGIGKTRLLDETAAAAADKGFGVVYVGADEEIGGPFYVARTLLSAPALTRVAADAASKRTLKRAVGLVSGKRDATLESLPLEDQLLVVYDAARTALSTIASRKPLGIFLDDLQWSDPDSLRLIRYVIRSEIRAPLFVMLASRPDVPDTRRAILGMSVDAERLGVGRRVALDRLSAAETTELLARLLEGPVSTKCAEAIFAQSEGVPFIVKEIVRSLREAGTVQSIDGTWEIARGTERMVPASVQSLIERRAGALSTEAREVLADAAALGRRFALRDLAELTRLLKGDSAPAAAELAAVLDEAVGSGLVAEAPAGSRHDYAFTHDQARSVLAETHGRPRRGLLHGGVVRMLAAGGDVPPDRLADAAHHALLAEDLEEGARYSIAAARGALDGAAPEEALVLAEAALRLVTDPAARVELLRLQDHALWRLGRGEDRAAVLDELGRLASSHGDVTEGELLRRRASAARQVQDYALAEELGQIAANAAAASGDRAAELEAVLELGQTRLQSALGESFSPPPSEIDLDAAEQAFLRARELAERSGDERLLAATIRELGVIENGRAKRRAIELLTPHLLEGGRFLLPPEQAPEWQEIAVFQDRAKVLLGEALDIYERLDDRAGVLATVIALGYSHYNPGVRRGVAGVIEQIRKLRQRLNSMTTESERQTDEVHLLYSVHAYARYYHYADLALERGEEAHRAARTLGDRWMEFLAAGGLGLTHLEMGEVAEAERWLDRARAAAAIAPTPLRARRLELWRGMARAVDGDAAGALERLEKARSLAFEQRSRVGVLEAAAWLAYHSARLGADAGDETLLQRADAYATEAVASSEGLSLQIAWRPLAIAAGAQVALARGETERAAGLAREAVTVMDFRLLEPSMFEVLLLAARVLEAADGEAWDELRIRIREDLDSVAERNLDESVRTRWLAGPVQRELAERIGDVEVVHGAPPRRAAPVRELDQVEAAVWRFVARGLTNREIAGELGLAERAVAQSLKSVFSKLGVKSRAAATTIALREGIA